VAAFALCLALAAPALAGGNGTALSVVTDPGTPTCDSTSCSVSIEATATTSGSTAPAAILVSTDGGMTSTNLGTVATTDWTGSGRAKMVTETIALRLSASSPTVVKVCFVQPGANGNPLKSACADPLTITPPGTCADSSNGCAGGGGN
jgi:hypothetical protein